ncbi:MAG: hypothetical protein EPN25_10955 [Nitrospirae bacterium]|nr:MAG: hypothetical protein EPN25_10955 [Nitrospirota bacterium]
MGKKKKAGTSLKTPAPVTQQEVAPSLELSHKPTFSSYAAVSVLLIIIIFGLFLRYRAANHEYISQWDEAYHALVAKNLMAHPLLPTLYDNPVRSYDYKDYGSNHIWLHKPPLTLWLMSGAMAIGGKKEVVFRLPSVVLGTLAIFLTFLIGKELFGTMAGYIAALLHALNPLVIRLVSGTVPTDHTEVVVALFVEATFLVLIIAARRRSLQFSVLAGVLLGCGLLSKSLPAATALAAAPFFWRGKDHLADFIKPLALVLLTAVAIALPWQLYTSHNWPAEFAWEGQQVFRHLSQPLEGHSGDWDWYIKLIPTHYGGQPEKIWAQVAAYAVVIFSILYSLYRCIRERQTNLLAVLLWALVPYVVFSVAATKLMGYLALAIPAVLLLIGYTAATVISNLKNSFSEKGAFAPATVVNAVLAVIALVYLLPLAGDRLTADYSIAPWNAIYDYPIFREEMMKIRDAEGQKIIFGVGDYKMIQAMYYTGSPAYADVPSPEEIEGFIKKGYRPHIILDALRRNLEEVKTIAQNPDLVKKITFISVPIPQRQIEKSPFQN